MAEAHALLFAYCETPVHAGTGRSVGTVDLPIQRERITGYPIVQASSVKGVLRSMTTPNGAEASDDAERHRAVFGPDDPQKAHEHAGALQVTDLSVVLFPVRSLAGVFAWTTSLPALARLGRLAALAGVETGWTLPEQGPDGQAAWVAQGSALAIDSAAGRSIVLEEFSFTAETGSADFVQRLGGWLAENALPAGEEYGWWKRNLTSHLCVLPDDAFRDFVQYGTEIEAHVRLAPTTKTVEQGALWTTEAVPAETLFAGLLAATRSRYPKVKDDGQSLLSWLTLRLDGARTRIGGDETTGRGSVALRVVQGGGQRG
uniref:Type III-B CRISPR module RAMP protein Cmr4 n=1 Tax=Thermorudis peleae TaxID=1382356 RepID=A0A831THK1_9BACT